MVVKNGSYDWSQGVAGEGLLEAGIVLNREQCSTIMQGRLIGRVTIKLPELTWLEMKLTRVGKADKIYVFLCHESTLGEKNYHVRQEAAT